MAWMIGISYWAGAAMLWLPCALALRAYAEKRRGVEDLLAGIVLAVVWPISAPILALLVVARRFRTHRAISHAGAGSVLVRT
jgi:hypothetical protein